MPLTDQEKVRIRDHLAYANTSELSTFVLGLPAGIEMQFLIEKAMSDFVLEEAVPLIREILCQLDENAATRRQVRQSMATAAIGAIQLRDPSEALKAVNDDYIWLIGRLANAFAIPKMPFDRRGGGINVRVA